MLVELNLKVQVGGNCRLRRKEGTQRAFAFSPRQIHSFAMSALEIQHMPREEKLRLMETLWEDLSRDEAAFESPAWHAGVLRETSERRKRGGETTLKWEQAKAKLRKGEG
jgi:hypothetical protein